MFGLATWGARWIFGEPDAHELDPDLLLWWLHRQIDPTDLPGPRFTVYVPFSDHPKRYWIVIEDDVSLCLADLGFDVDVTLRGDRAALYETYLGRRSLDEARRNGSVSVDGSQAAVRSFFEALQQSLVAGIVRQEGVSISGLEVTGGPRLASWHSSSYRGDHTSNCPGASPFTSRPGDTVWTG